MNSKAQIEVIFIIALVVGAIGYGVYSVYNLNLPENTTIDNQNISASGSDSSSNGALSTSQIKEIPKDPILKIISPQSTTPSSTPKPQATQTASTPRPTTNQTSTTPSNPPTTNSTSTSDSQPPTAEVAPPAEYCGNGNCNKGYENSYNCPQDCGNPPPAVNTCSNGIKDNGETAVDCGGPCPVCIDYGNITFKDQAGQELPRSVFAYVSSNFDFIYSAYQMGLCRNGILNEGETEIDCGGTCFSCPATQETYANASYSYFDLIIKANTVVNVEFKKTTNGDGEMRLRLDDLTIMPLFALPSTEPVCSVSGITTTNYDNQQNLQIPQFNTQTIYTDVEGSTIYNFFFRFSEDQYIISNNNPVTTITMTCNTPGIYRMVFTKAYNIDRLGPYPYSYPTENIVVGVTN